jgi:hypothetical protein
MHCFFKISIAVCALALAQSYSNKAMEMPPMVDPDMIMQQPETEADRKLANALADPDPAALRAALAEHADPNRRDSNGLTPLHRLVTESVRDPIIYRRIITMTQELLEAGADATARDEQGRTALDYMNSHLVKAQNMQSNQAQPLNRHFIHYVNTSVLPHIERIRSILQNQPIREPFVTRIPQIQQQPYHPPIAEPRPVRALPSLGYWALSFGN